MLFSRVNGRCQIQEGIQMMQLFPGAGKSCKFSFTLIELLVVIAVIALLIAILIPSLVVIKERARRVVCSKNVNQFIVGLLIYAEAHDKNLPCGLSDRNLPNNPFENLWTDEHTPVLSRKMRDAMVDILGSHNALMCPWLSKPFDDDDGWYYDDYGYIIGYNYLGGHLYTPWPLVGPANTEWKSPQSSTDNQRMPVVVELNAWTTSTDQIFAPHGPRGPLNQYCEGGGNNQTPEDIGAAGGNIGLLDGSVSWKKIDEMKIYRSSRSHGIDGCFSVW